MQKGNDGNITLKNDGAWGDLIIQFRWLVLMFCVLFVAVAGYGAQNLKILTDYRAFFSPENPELVEFEKFQETYVKTDNLFFYIKPKDGNVFTKETLSAIEELTKESWKIPFSTRVDSITNFQYTYAIANELVVEDLIEDVKSQTDSYIAKRKMVALKEPLILDQLLTKDASSTAVNILIQLPGINITELPDAYNGAKSVRDLILKDHPNIDIRISGMTALNNAFAADGQEAMMSLMPIMFLVILVLSILFIRSVTAVLTMLLVIVLSVAAAMGLAGYLGIGISPVSAAAPIVILTLAVADSMHILIAYRGYLAEGMQKHPALKKAVQSNILPISVTSLTTIIGFLALNFSDAPPFGALGNISALGIAAAWILSLTLFPAVLSMLPMKPSTKQPFQSFMKGLANIIIENYQKCFFIALILSAGLIVLIPQLEVNDMFTEYFDQRVDFRKDIDVIKQDFGPLTIDYSIPSNEAGGVSEPEYLQLLENFSTFLRMQPKVTHVFSYTDIIKRLNKNMNADNDDYYKIPNDRNLAAQYLLLYELSLPFGLDLNDRINIDKSASRISISVKPITTAETKILLKNIEQWFVENAPHIKPQAASPQIMFTHIADRNLESMIVGTLIAILAISIIMMLALRSVRLGILSIIPNALPILSAFGVWVLLVGEVGFSVAIVGSISLGIVVDDTVHFLMKYVRALHERNLDTNEAIRYAFESVGAAIVINTVILTAGFMILTQATFKATVDMGLLTAISLILALIIDFLMLPALLVWVGHKKPSYTNRQ